MEKEQSFDLFCTKHLLPALERLEERAKEAGIPFYRSLGADYRPGTVLQYKGVELFATYMIEVDDWEAFEEGERSCGELYMILRPLDFFEESIERQTAVIPEEQMLFPAEAADTPELLTLCCRAFASGAWMKEKALAERIPEQFYRGDVRFELITRLNFLIGEFRDRGWECSEVLLEEERPFCLLETDEQLIELSFIRFAGPAGYLLRMEALPEDETDIWTEAVFPDFAEERNGDYYENLLGLFERYFMENGMYRLEEDEEGIF